jgi:hypothetical protein
VPDGAEQVRPVVREVQRFFHSPDERGLITSM